MRTAEVSIEPVKDSATPVVPDDQRSTWSRAGRGLGHALVDFLLEAIVAALACLLLAGVVAAVLWGWREHRAATSALVTAFAGFVVYGAWNLRPSARPVRSAVAATAAGVALLLLIWLAYTLMQCSCL